VIENDNGVEEEEFENTEDENELTATRENEGDIQLDIVETKEDAVANETEIVRENYDPTIDLTGLRISYP
jgi:hypothetical protein